MIKSIIVIVALASSLRAHNNLDYCNQVASKFANTCTSGPAKSVSDMEGEEMTCSGQPSCPGTQSGDSCTWTRKLCVTCWEDTHGTVKVRVQSNGLPDHCFFSPETPQEMNNDYEAIFSAEITRTVQSPTTQNQVNNVLCDIMRTSNYNIPRESKPIQHGSNMDTSVGITITGINMFNALSADDVDPYYPAIYGKVTNITAATEHVDKCLGHPNPMGLTYHYHIPSPCMWDKNIDLAPCTKENDCDPKTNMLESFADKKERTVIGIARDGRVVYGPYDDDGALASNLDVCNGKQIEVNGDQNYVYFGRDVFPYFVGCFGPGNYPDYVPECTSNPPDGYEGKVMFPNTRLQEGMSGAFSLQSAKYLLGVLGLALLLF